MSQLPNDFFDSEADGKTAQKILSKKWNKPIQEADDGEWEEFQKEIQLEIKESSDLKESELKSQEVEKRADQAYEQLQYEKRILKLLSRSSEIQKENITMTKTELPVKKKLKIDIEPDTFEESD